jgi:hypothetical protein
MRPSADYEIARALWNPNCHYAALCAILTVTVTVLSQINSVYTLTPSLFRTLNIILSYTLMSLKWCRSRVSNYILY